MQRREEMSQSRFCGFCEENSRQYEKELSSLRAKLKEAEEALKFYADKDNYGCDDTNRTTGNNVYDVVLFDFDPGSKDDFAGRRARLAIAKIRGEK
jgi:hypothetical protein